MNDFKENLKLEDFDGGEELRKVAEKAKIHPMLPTKYNAIKRARLRAFEKELLSSESTISGGRYLKSEMSEEDYLISKINNVLNGDAMSTKEDFSMSSDEKIAKMNAIESLKHYLDNYEENIKLINQAKEYNLRIEDDGR